MTNRRVLLTQKISGCAFHASGRFLEGGITPPIDGVAVDAGKCVEIEAVVYPVSAAVGQYSECRVSGLNTYTNTARVDFIAPRWQR